MTEPAPLQVLDYADPPRSRPVMKWLLPIVFVIACAGFGALFQSLLQPRVYVATGLIQVQSPLTTISALPDQQAAHVKAIASRALGYVQPLSAAGVKVTTQDMTERLQAAAIPESKLIRVSYRSRNPGEATTVTNTIINLYTGAASGVQIASLAVRPAAPEHNVLYPLLGALIGAAAAPMLLAFYRHRQQQA